MRESISAFYKTLNIYINPDYSLYEEYILILLIWLSRDEDVEISKKESRSFVI